MNDRSGPIILAICPDRTSACRKCWSRRVPGWSRLRAMLTAWERLTRRTSMEIDIAAGEPTGDQNWPIFCSPTNSIGGHARPELHSRALPVIPDMPPPISRGGLLASRANPTESGGWATFLPKAPQMERSRPCGRPPIRRWRGVLLRPGQETGRSGRGRTVQRPQP